MKPLNDEAILITGGTGSFGTAFVKHILANHNVKRLVVYSRDELKQFEMATELNAPNLRYFIGDVRDAGRLAHALHGIDTVIHAAAMKQVVASEYNPIECIMTNVIGAENVINASIRAGVKRVIALSTDKAVNPINLYGASKLCADKLFIAANNITGKEGCRFSIVRYGNVIGSRGSVIPVFRNQVKSGKLNITDTRMTRFWLTVGQGVSFVLRSLSLMHGGEVFVPKIPSMRIVDLAKAIGPDCEQVVTGIRPGEKLHEIMIPVDEARQTEEFDDYYVIHPDFTMWKTEAEKRAPQRLRGRPVPEDFCYRSDDNKMWVTDAEMLQLITSDGTE